MKLRPILRGIKSYLPWKKYIPGTCGSRSGRYCYSVWLRHFSVLADHGLARVPETIAELGPGDSLGLGLAGLLSGAERYFALDVVQHLTDRRNLEVFAELKDLFRRRAAIPDHVEFPGVFPRLAAYDYPAHLLPEERIAAALDPARCQRIESCLNDLRGAAGPAAPLSFHCPWFDAAVIEVESVELILSQAVLEHVEDLPATYRAMHSWLKPGGFMSHQIDFRSHGTARSWNGHWACPDFLWRVVRGRLPFLINREPLSTHLRLLAENGFEMVTVLPVAGEGGIRRRRLAPRFRHLTDRGLTTCCAHVLARKPRA